MYVIVVSVPILGGLLDVSNFFRLECDFLELKSKDRLGISNIELIVLFVRQIFLLYRLFVLITL